MKIMMIASATPFNRALYEDLRKDNEVEIHWTESGDVWEERSKLAGEPLDLLVVSLLSYEEDAHTILDRQDTQSIQKLYDHVSIGTIRVINQYLPCLEAGQGKRIAVITSVKASNQAAVDGENLGMRISLAALNMGLQLLFNQLRPLGYTFRLYAAQSMQAAEPFAGAYILQNRSNEPQSAKHSDENRLVMRDERNREIPW